MSKLIFELNDFDGAIEYAADRIKKGKLTNEILETIAENFENAEDSERVVKTVVEMANAAKG